MQMDITDEDLEGLYYALGCLSPSNDAHKPLCMFIARIEVQAERNRMRAPTWNKLDVSQFDEKPALIPGSIDHARDQAGFAPLPGDYGRAKVTTTIAARLEDQPTPTVSVRDPQPLALTGLTEGYTVRDLADVAEELHRLSKLLSEDEFALVQLIHKHTGHVPKVTCIEREGEMKGVNIRYRYRSAQGEYEAGTVGQEHGRANEMVLLALRQTLQRVRQQHVPEGE